jgi:uncharacterized protein (DUF2126 family)
VRILLQHHSRYAFPRPAALGPHLVRLKPANHTRARVETYGLRVAQECQLHWQQDPHGNHLARLAFRRGSRHEALTLTVEMALDIRPVNPFDFLLDDCAQSVPIAYPPEARAELAPFLERGLPAFTEGPLFRAFDAELPREGTTLSVLVELNRRVNARIAYVLRDEPGVWTPEETLARGRGSCRDSAVLLVSLLRSRGIAARFVSGYLVQLADEGMLPDQPKGVSRDVADLHAWAEAYLPGAGWVGLDATSGLLCGEGHIPLACTASPQLAAPLEGTTDVAAESVSFELKVARLGHEVRPTAPFPDAAYAALLAGADRADALLAEAGLPLTSGGEPTFNSREHAAAPEWNGEALGPSKWSQGLRLCAQLRERLMPGAALLAGQGKHYPGESLPRWTLELIGRTDGLPLWTGDIAGVPSAASSAASSAAPSAASSAAPGGEAVGKAEARRFAAALAARLGVEEGLLPAFEDPWRFVQDEARLPTDVDPLAADLKDGETRRRLARVLERGLATEAGFVLPLARREGAWVTDRWQFRRGQLFLLQGDSPIGLRLPLSSLPWAVTPPPHEEPCLPPDPRRPEAQAEEARLWKEAQAREEALRRADVAKARGEALPPEPQALVPQPARPPARDTAAKGLHTALCVEARDGALRVFLPPLERAEDFLALVEAVDLTRESTGLPVLLEGYPPPRSPLLTRFAVTPDPGVLEVNLPPARSGREHALLLETCFDAALHAGLHSEKYLLDGRMAGSGGGHHLTLGGPTPLTSPLLTRPDVLASLITLVQHHPSLSFLFTGLFVGPTSQAPRVDEARHDALYELEIALEHAFSFREAGRTPAPWEVDALFRHLLVDVTGNTHRAELCIDKLYDWRTPHGRQGVLELRAFEMPAHPRLAVAQAVLVRALVAAVAKEPYRAPLVRWGTGLHDRFLLPHFLWKDFEEVLGFLARRGVPLPEEAFRPFLELRCPVAGRVDAGGGVLLEVRNALEPWHVLGEEPSGGGTSRYVDSSVERVQVRVEGFVPERHRVLVNGQLLPLKATGTSGEAVAGVRFRAWAPPHALHPHLGVHHPLRFDVVDTWAERSLGACGYHVWHPEGRAYDAEPLTRFEAEARRSARFTPEAPLPWPVQALPSRPHPESPCTLDLRRYRVDRAPPRPDALGAADGTGAAGAAGPAGAEALPVVRLALG